MKTKVVLFDLDGTLLPMDQEVFIKAYFGGVAKRLALNGYEPKKLISTIYAGTMAMINNNGEKNNEGVFWDTFARVYGEKARQDEPYFEAYYKEDFDSVKQVCGYNPKAFKTLLTVKDLGLRVVLATNPIFPAIATKKRIAWAGLNEESFELITTYENSTYCKPNLNYYLEICNKLNVKPEECIMVGNDVDDDMVAKNLKMKVFLLTDCLINKNNANISLYPNGNFEHLISYINELI